MNRASFGAALLGSFVAGAGSQAASAQGIDGGQRAAELFARACVASQGDPRQVRVAAQKLGGGPLIPEAQATFLKGRSGVGFGFTEGSANWAVVSEDNGACHVYLGRSDTARLLPALEVAARRQNGSFAAVGKQDTPERLSQAYALTAAGRTFDVVASINKQPGAVRAIITMAPQPGR